MAKVRNRIVQRTLALLLCIAVMSVLYPIPASALESPLAFPTSVSLTDMDGAAFTPGQELTPGEGFYITYGYGTVENIDSTLKYTLPTLSNQLEVLYEFTENEIIALPVVGTDGQSLGTLEVNTLNGAMTFQFDEYYHEQTLDDFFLKFNVALDEDAVEIGDDIIISFPIEGGTADFEVTVADTEKDPPQIVKSGALSTDGSASGHVEILWTITVTNAENPQKNITIQDTWSNNQEYVDGSFCIGGVPVAVGLSINDDGRGLQYERTGITSNCVDIITYKTRIESSAFLKNGVPLTGGNIKCTNTAQAYFPDGSDTSLTNPETASYSHPITWLYKTSGDVIDRETGEMEWTITIYNNGLGMLNVVLYDRLSPGVSIKNNTATMQIGNNPVQTLNDFQRVSDSDLYYNSDSSRAYNISYALGNIGNVAVIKYRTIITNMAEYDAGAHLPPDSIFDNRAFITYQLPNGGSSSPVIASPVVEKTGGYDAGLIGKEGSIEPAYHTIKWKLTVNSNAEELKGVTVTDKLTYAAPITALPRAYRLCNHVYDDSIQRNKPQYSLDGKKFKDFTPYNAASPNTAFTYRLVPSGTEVYEIVFNLGDIDQEIIIVFRSTATDKIIYANNVTGSNCGYENKASMVTIGNAFGYASADVVYKSDVYQKHDARSWFNKAEHTYIFEKNQLPWLMRVNINQMEMTNICITDTLNEGTSLVEGSVIVGSGTIAWYKLKQIAGTMAVPKYTDGAAKPYYTYDEETREMKIYLEDIKGSVVGTDNATKQVVFYVQVDVDHPIFNDPTYPGFITNKNGIWAIPNTGFMGNDYLSNSDAVKEGAVYNISVQHLKKAGTAYKNGENYSIDYTIDINRIQQTLPEIAVIQDTLPIGLRLDSSTLHLYEATVLSPEMFYVRDDGTNGTIVKGAEIDPLLYQLDTEVDGDGITTMRITLPQNSGTKMYVAEYSCDVIDVSKAPFTNNAVIEGVNQSNADQTITRLLLKNAAGGGTMRNVVKTAVYVTKTNSVSGIAVEGAEFGLYYNDKMIQKKTTDENGQIIFENLNKDYTYTIKELEPAPGYLAPEEVSETIVATDITDPVRLAFENTPIEGTVRFMKTDEAGTALAGAEFGIWKNAADIGVNAPFATAISGQTGFVDFSSLTAGNTYYIAEIAAPENYRKSDEVIVAQMGIDGTMEKLWLQSDMDAKAITSFENSAIPLSTLVVSKTVTGIMGDRTKAFVFTLTVKTGVGLPAGSILTGTKTTADGTEEDVTITVGEAYIFTLAHSEFLTVNGLQPGTEYTVSEDDYSADGYTTTCFTSRNDVAEQPTNGQSTAGTIASGENIESFTNRAIITVPTGVAFEIRPNVLIILLALTANAILLRKRKRKRQHEKETY